MASVRFALPRGMEPLKVAQAISAYLLGSLVYTNEKNPDGTFQYGPYSKGRSENSWQLDTSNDYWLDIKGTECHLYDRYNQQVLLDTIVQLFKLRHDPPIRT